MDLTVRIYYEDTDCGGVVYYANYLRYFERARTEFLRDEGVDLAEVIARGVQFVVAEAAQKYMRSARYNDLLRIETRLVGLKRASFTLGNWAWRGEELLVSGMTTLASVDLKGKPVRLPADIHEVLEKRLEPMDAGAPTAP